MVKPTPHENNRILVLGGGDIATGTINKLHNSGFNLLVLEKPTPTAVRRMVAHSEAVYLGRHSVEGITSQVVDSCDECQNIWQQGNVPILADSDISLVDAFQPLAIVDCTLRKRNYQPIIELAPLTIGVGPGFEAGLHVHVIIESCRGHHLGRLIHQGKAIDNHGVPAAVEGYTNERVNYAGIAGIWHPSVEIGTSVCKGDTLGTIDNVAVYAGVSGVVRGILRGSLQVAKGNKLADIDPRIDQRENCYTISEKARCIGGGVLEAIMLYLRNHHEDTFL